MLFYKSNKDVSRKLLLCFSYVDSWFYMGGYLRNRWISNGHHNCTGVVVKIKCHSIRTSTIFQVFSIKIQSKFNFGSRLD